jgi:YVTN family beta-propeller protein
MAVAEPTPTSTAEGEAPNAKVSGDTLNEPASGISTAIVEPTPSSIPTAKAIPEIPVGHQPFDMAVTPNGRKLYVVNSGGDTVTPIRVSTNTAGTPIPVPHQPFTLAVTPNGKTLYVTGGANLLIPIRTSNNHPGTPIVVGVSPSAIAFAMVR